MKKIVGLFIYFVMFGFMPCILAASKNADLEIIIIPIIINIFCNAILLYQQSIFDKDLEKIKHKLGIKDEDIY